jgi:hypothetical protein
MHIKKAIGESSRRFDDTIEASRIAAFRQAVGAGAGDAAPPTFLTIFRRGEFDLFQKMELPLSAVLHGEQEYEYGEPIRAGDRVSHVAKLASAVEKKGKTGTLTFLVFETEVSIERGAAPAVRAGLSRTTVVVRS